MSLGFLINAAGVQHTALLSRQLRYVALTVIEITSLLISIAIGIGMALADFGYWALVGSTLALTTFITMGVWIASGWIPGMPRRDEHIRSMLGFGGIVTLNGLIVYCGYNLEKVLLGRFWGAMPSASMDGPTRSSIFRLRTSMPRSAASRFPRCRVSSTIPSDIKGTFSRAIR